MDTANQIGTSPRRKGRVAGEAAASNGPGSGAPAKRDPETPAEAAQQFEKVLVKKFVEVMTKNMFSSSLGGEESGWMKSQRDTQRDMMTDTLTDHLVESGALEISDRLMHQWGTAPEAPEFSPVIEQTVDPLSESSPPTHDGPRFDRAA